MLFLMVSNLFGVFCVITSLLKNKKCFLVLLFLGVASIGSKSSSAKFVSSKSSKIVKADKPIVRWHGGITQNAASAIYATMLNNKIDADKTNWVRTTLDLKFDSELPSNLIKVHADFRHRAYWGADATRTEKASFALLDVFNFDHNHPVSKPPLWMKSAWLDVALDKSFTKQNESLGFNRFKIGYFPHAVGSGAAFGEAYGVAQDFLSIFVRNSDFHMPAFMFFGRTAGGFLEYDLYFGRPEARSASPSQTLAYSKGHLVDLGGLPLGGSFRDDTILALQLRISSQRSSLDDSAKSGYKLELNPYSLAYFAPDKKVNFEADSSVNLYTMGLAGLFESKYFDFNWDAACNLGEQVVRRVDQNVVKLSRDSVSGACVEQYSKILTAADKKPALVTDALKAELAKHLHRDLASFDVAGTSYVSASDRISPTYKNKFRGYMGLLEFSAKIPDHKVAFSGIMALSSGDTNPHSNTIDKKYNGFVGINESFEPKRVKSTIVFSGIIRRPMALESDKDPKLTDFLEGAFTDIRILGAGLSFKPELFENAKTGFSLNVLGYWKDHQGYKLSVTTDADGNSVPAVSDQKARRFLGMECNFLVEVVPMDGLKFAISTGLFMPGGYYTDIKGAKLEDSTTKMLSASDLDASVKNVYASSDSIAYILGCEFKYSF